jgi:hypothetical protein
MHIEKRGGAYAGFETDGGAEKTISLQRHELARYGQARLLPIAILRRNTKASDTDSQLTGPL